MQKNGGESQNIDLSKKKIKDENQHLKKQLLDASLINELGKVLHTTTDQEKITKTILLGIQEIAGFDRIIFFEIDKENFQLVPKSFIGMKKDDVEDLRIPLGFEGGDITDAIFLKRHLIVDDIFPEDDPFGEKLDSTSYLVYPLTGRVIPDFKEQHEDDESFIEEEKRKSVIDENERRKLEINSSEFNTQGIFWMDRVNKNQPIVSDDISTLSMITTQAGVIFDNHRMYQAIEIANENLEKTNGKLKTVNSDLRKAQAKISQDLEHARKIQHGLLPQEIPETESLKIKAVYIPADAVGGDYYDAFEISPGVYALIVADVSGHGVSSSLIMSMVKVLLKTFADKFDSPQKTLEQINKIFQSQINTSNFVTVFYSIFDTNKNKVTYTSAGHCPILLIDKEEITCREIKADGLFLGVFPDMMLNEVSLEFSPGNNRFILFTDGIIEARNPEGEMFENSRLIEISMNTVEDDPDTALKKIMDFQAEFCGKGHIRDDDFTLLVVDF